MWSDTNESDQIKKVEEKNMTKNTEGSEMTLEKLGYVVLYSIYVMYLY